MNQTNSSRVATSGAAGLALLATLAACGGASGGLAGDAGAPGETVVKPGATPGFDGDDFYIVDANEGGNAETLQLIQTSWGRLVDIVDTREVPGTGEVESRLIYADFVIDPTAGANSQAVDPRWELSTNVVTGEQVLRIKAEAGADDGLFNQFVAEASSLVAIDPTSLAASEIPPFPLVPRNAAVVLQFNDLLDESTTSTLSAVQVFTGGPPTTPFDARIITDRNRGGVTQGAFHSTRVIVDFTISELELETISQVVQINGVGLPASDGAGSANVAIRIPSQADPGLGLFSVLSNLSGNALDPFGNDVVDFASPTLDVVRALRSGNGDDPNGGFLIDTEAPRVLGIQPARVTSFAVDPLGTARDFVVSYDFLNTACAFDAVPGDLVDFQGFKLEVTATNATSGGTAVNTRMRLPMAFDLSILDSAAELASQVNQVVQYTTPWRSGDDDGLDLPSLPASQAPCFVRFSPNAGDPLGALVDPEAQLLVRFSEPLAPETVNAFETFFIGRRAALDTVTDELASENSAVPAINDLVLGRILISPDARDLRFVPELPFEHALGSAETYFFNTVSNLDAGLTDLAGNKLADALPEVAFSLDPGADPQNTGGWALRFKNLDQDSVEGVDLAGQFIFDSNNGRLLPRSLQRFPALVDRNQDILALMTPPVGTAGLPEPLVSAGSRMQHIWRYADAGYEVTQQDGTFYNLDIEGVSLSPVAGQVVTAIYDEFEMSVGHGKNLFDEAYSTLPVFPFFPTSGLGPADNFTENYLDPGPTVVHPKTEGYVVSNSNLFLASTNTPMIRMPWNLNVPDDEKRYWTWRDTAIVERGTVDDTGNLLHNGAPVTNEIGGSNLSDIFGPDKERTNGDVYGFPVGANGVIPAAGNNEGDIPAGIPTGGLPILLEYRCFPTEQTSLNLFDYNDVGPAVAQGYPVVPTGFLTPHTRAYSSGGVNLAGVLIEKDPDLQQIPDGGFVDNPGATALGVPAGTPTPARDKLSYIGQMDVVLRVSRVHTVVIDAENTPGTTISALLPGFSTASYEPDYTEPLVEPTQAEQPEGTSLVFAFRGTDRNVIGNPANDILDGSNLDLYGQVAPGPLTELDDMGVLVLVAESPAELFSFDSGESGGEDWQDSVDGVDGLRFVQTRISFISNPITGESPTLSTFGLSFRR